MFKKFPIPASYSLVREGRAYLLLRNQYKAALLKMGIGDIRTFLTYQQPVTYLNGRTPHPSISISGDERMIIRQYSHGGFLRGFTKTLYFSGARSFRELSLTEEIRSMGIPTVQPIGAIHEPLFPPLYRAYLLILEIPHALNLIQFLKKIGSLPSGQGILAKREVIRKTGVLIRRFHQSGFFHNDLQLKNLLVASDEVLIIDFDRSCRKKDLSFKERINNLLRLNRSVEKWKKSGLPVTRSDRWRFLMAYAGEDEEFLKALRKSLRFYAVSLFFHRSRWGANKVLRGLWK